MTSRSFLPGVDDVGSDVAGADALPDRLLAGADVLRRSAAALAALTEKQRMRALAGLALCWRDPEDEFRREALERLPDECSLSPEMVAWGIEQAFSVVTEEGMRHWWREEAQGKPYVGRSPPPELSGHVWAGNVFVAGLPPVIASLLAGSPALVKAPDRFPTFALLLARSMKAHAPELGNCLGAAAWSRDDVAATHTFLDNLDLLFAFGDDDSIAVLEQQFVRRIVGFGHRYSVAAISAASLGSDAVLDELIDRLAVDHFAWDGQGCLTPRWVFVEGSAEIARLLAERAAERLPSLVEQFPAGPLSDEEAAARSAWLGETGFQGWSRGGAGWSCASLAGSTSLRLVPPPRSMCFLPVDELGDLPVLLDPLGPRLQGLSLAGSETLRDMLAEALEPLGLSRIARPGELQRPPVHWSHDGVRILGQFF